VSGLPSEAIVGPETDAERHSRSKKRAGDGLDVSVPNGQHAVYDPFSDTPFLEVVRAWHAGETSKDPFEALIQLQRAEANYLEHEHQDEAGARRSRRFADRLERLIHAVRHKEISYKEAAGISTWAYTTIKNLKRGGRVPIAELAIGPATPGLQALRAVDAINSRRARQHEDVTSRKPRSAKDTRMYELGQRRNGHRRGG
jgi:hypothetical protein